jgi:chromate transporter
MKNETSFQSLREIAVLFLRLGATSFGGPAAYIAIMHHEIVVRRKWLSDEGFLDIIGAVNLIPGPNATEVASHIGLIRAGWRGLLLAGVLFILPGAAAVIAVAWAYTRYGSVPQVGWVLYGVKPAIIAVIVQAVWSLGKRGIHGLLPMSMGLITLALYLVGINELILLFGSAAVVLLVRGGWKFIRRGASACLFLPLTLLMPSVSLPAAITAFSQAGLFLTFLKIGATLFGSGYVLLAYLNSDFVQRLAWLTKTQILDAIAVAGQITPGPVFNSAAFIGYLLGGWPSAVLAILGIFLPSFILVATLSRFLPSMRKSRLAGNFLDGISAASLGLMAAICIQLGRVIIVDLFTIFVVIAALLLVFRFKISSVWLVLCGGALGALYKFFSG